MFYNTDVIGAYPTAFKTCLSQCAEICVGVTLKNNLPFVCTYLTCHLLTNFDAKILWWFKTKTFLHLAYIRGLTQNEMKTYSNSRIISILAVAKRNNYNNITTSVGSIPTSYSLETVKWCFQRKLLTSHA